MSTHYYGISDIISMVIYVKNAIIITEFQF